MSLLKSSYNIISISENLSSLFSAAYCATKKHKVLILNNSDSEIVSCEDFKLYPYELPIIGIKGNDYLANFFSLIGMDKANSLFIKKPEPITIVMGKHRFDYYIENIKDEIGREFKKNKLSLIFFIEELIEIENKIPPLWVNESGFPSENFFDWYKLFSRFPKRLRNLLWSDISLLYKKHKLPYNLCSMFDALLFAMSGVINKDYPLICAAKILVSALKGVLIPKESMYTLRGELVKLIPNTIEIRNNVEISTMKRKKGTLNVRLESFEGWINSDYVITDKSRLSQETNSQEYTKFPYTLYVWVDKDYIPEAMSKCLMYLDVDKAGWFNFNDIYMVKYTQDNIGCVISITSFIPYKHLHSPLITYKDKTIKMASILENLIPYLGRGSARLYPDPYSPNFDIELQHSLENLRDCSVIYDMRKEKKVFASKENGFYYCGREILPQMGFEGLMISGLKTADKVIRRT